MTKKYNFKKDNFCVIKNAISIEFAEFFFNYFLMKKQVYDTCSSQKYISPYEKILGYYEGPNDQVPDTYTSYSDIAMETLLLKLKPIMEKTTNLKLIPNYTYARVYKRGDELKRHKDRFSCEISTTLNLGGDPWPIYIEPDSKKGKFVEQGYQTEMTKGVQVDLAPGDMLVYRGNILEHWRESFDFNTCVQVFLHYNNAATAGSEENKFDRRPHLGLPNWFKKQ